MNNTYKEGGSRLEISSYENIFTLHNERLSLEFYVFTREQLLHALGVIEKENENTLFIDQIKLLETELQTSENYSKQTEIALRIGALIFAMNVNKIRKEA